VILFIVYLPFVPRFYCVINRFIIPTCRPAPVALYKATTDAGFTLERVFKPLQVTPAAKRARLCVHHAVTRRILRRGLPCAFLGGFNARRQFGTIAARIAASQRRPFAVRISRRIAPWLFIMPPSRIFLPTLPTPAAFNRAFATCL
jgi:hypothetical protein